MTSVVNVLMKSDANMLMTSDVNVVMTSDVNLLMTSDVNVLMTSDVSRVKKRISVLLPQMPPPLPTSSMRLPPTPARPHRL